MQKIDLEKLNEDELINLAETDTKEFRWNISDIYEIALKKYEEKGEKEKTGEMKMEKIVFDLSTHNKDKRFDAMMSGITDKGEEWKYPDIDKHFDKKVIEYYKKRAIVTNNPILKARYSDVVWVVGKREINFAKIAIRAYLDCCPIYYENEWDKD